MQMKAKRIQDTSETKIQLKHQGLQVCTYLEGLSSGSVGQLALQSLGKVRVEPHARTHGCEDLRIGRYACAIDTLNGDAFSLLFLSRHSISP